MSGMGGCSDFNNLCSEDSVVKQCTEVQGTASLISTSAATQAAISACSQHSMPGCELCSSQTECTDPLLGLAQVCQTMLMPSCSSLVQMCSDTSNSDLGVFCDDSLDGTNPTPYMKMYFHTGILEYILFKDFVPSNNTEYSLAWMFVFVLGVLNAYVKVIKARFAYKFMNSTKTSLLLSREELESVNNPNDNNKSEPNSYSQFTPLPLAQIEFTHNLLLSSLMLVILTIDFLLMLIAMTFNVGLFFAVVGGMAVGSFFYAAEIRARGSSIDPTCC